MNDDSTQRDEDDAGLKNEEYRDAQAGTLPWLDGAVEEELFSSSPL
jgi:hypothetical protein